MGTALQALPYWRLSGYYLFYFVTVGALMPYLSLYLERQGHTATRIGWLLAALTAGRVIAPILWGYLADRGGTRLPIVRATTAVAALAFGVFWLLSDPIALAAALLFFGCFWSAGLPLMEATTLDHLGTAAYYYARIRLWGSIGFILSVVSLGFAIERAGPAFVPGAVIAALAGVWAMTLAIPETRHASRHRTTQGFLHVLRERRVVLLFVVCFLVQMAHGPYYGFYSLYLELHGYPGGQIGKLWALGVVAEVGIFLVMQSLIRRHGLRVLFATAAAGAILRWWIIGSWAENLGMLLLAQLLHAATFGLHHATAIHLVQHAFGPAHAGRGQALYSALCFGLGGVCGTAMSGWLWDASGPSTAFHAAALISGLALAGAIFVKDTPPTRRA